MIHLVSRDHHGHILGDQHNGHPSQPEVDII